MKQTKEVKIQDYLTVSQAQEMMGVTRQGVHWLFKRGTIKAVRIGKLWLVSQESVKDWLSNKNL
jgi:excisionase family DNA binding protein